MGNMEKKYEFVECDTIEVDGTTLHRIRALRDFYDVRKGDLGGYIKKEDNLSHSGLCWVYNNAKVYGNAIVRNDAEIRGTSTVYDDARVSDWAYICGNARIFGYATARGTCRVGASVSMHDRAKVFGDAMIYGNAELAGNVAIYDNIHISMDAIIKSNYDYLYMAGLGSVGRSTTFFRCSDGTIKVNCGCFSGTLDEFRSKVRATHGNRKYAKEYLMAADLVELRLKDEK